jgi:hypothetical protein
VVLKELYYLIVFLLWEVITIKLRFVSTLFNLYTVYMLCISHDINELFTSVLVNRVPPK